MLQKDQKIKTHFSNPFVNYRENSKKSRACRNSTSTRSHDCVFVRNMVIYGAYEMGKKSDFL